MKTIVTKISLVGGLIWFTGVSSPATAQDNCTLPHRANPSLVLARTQACFCDANLTLCEPNDLCFRLPPEGYDDDQTITDEAYDAFSCLLVPCDDVSGDWIYVTGVESDELVVSALVKITQSNCDSEIELSTANETIVYYATLDWREVYFMYVYETSAIRDSYSVEGTFVPDSDQPLTLVQNFESSEPTCPFSGELFGENNGVGILLRTLPTVSFEIGQELTRDELPLACPPGYPKQWMSDGPIIDTAPNTTAVPVPAVNPPPVSAVSPPPVPAVTPATAAPIPAVTPATAAPIPAVTKPAAPAVSVAAVPTSSATTDVELGTWVVVLSAFAVASFL